MTHQPPPPHHENPWQSSSPQSNAYTAETEQKQSMRVPLIIAAGVLACGIIASLVIYLGLGPDNSNDGVSVEEQPSTAAQPAASQSAETTETEKASAPRQTHDGEDNDAEEKTGGSPETDGSCPSGYIEIYNGHTQGHDVKICQNDRDSGQYSYVGGSAQDGYIVLPAEFSSEEDSSEQSATFFAENGSTTYMVSSDSLYVERGDPVGHTVLVDEDWISGNMDGLEGPPN